MNDHIKRHNDNILTRMRGMEAQPVSGMIDPKNPTNGPGSAPTHTPAVQPAGEMDDATLVDAMIGVWTGDGPDWVKHPAWADVADDMRLDMGAALAIARPVLQDQARRKALNDALRESELYIIANTGREDRTGVVTGQELLGHLHDWNSRSHTAAAILALKDKPNG